jgi:excisionase family DNA binding protein
MVLDQKRTYLTPNEVAELLMVSPVTVRAWAQKGMLRAVTTPGGHRRFLHADLELFKQQHGLAPQAPLDNAVLRVLIVDDEPLFASYLQELLTNFGKAIETAMVHNGFDAGYTVHTFKPHVVLLDLMMPDMDGFQVCQQIKQDPATSSIKVIAVTGDPSANNVERILKAGAECCLSKPFEPEELLTALSLQARASAG